MSPVSRIVSCTINHRFTDIFWVGASNDYVVFVDRVNPFPVQVMVSNDVNKLILTCQPVRQVKVRTYLMWAIENRLPIFRSHADQGAQIGSMTTTRAISMEIVNAQQFLLMGPAIEDILNLVEIGE